MINSTLLRKYKHYRFLFRNADFNNIEKWSGLIKGDIIFSALGTTNKDKGYSNETTYPGLDDILQKTQGRH